MKYILLSKIYVKCTLLHQFHSGGLYKVHLDVHSQKIHLDEPLLNCLSASFLQIEFAKKSIIYLRYRG